MSFFGSGAGDYNREVKTAGENAFKMLSQGAIYSRFEGMQDAYAPILAGMSQAAQVGANMDTQAIQANLARQGLGGTGLGAALGGGLRSGATMATNTLRAKLASEAMGQAIGLQNQQANILMQRALGQQMEPGAFQSTVVPIAQAVGAGFQTASLFQQPPRRTVNPGYSEA